MKILVLSDSHASLYFMRRAVQFVKPNAIIHLGDHYDDGQAMAEENPGLLFYQVPGNCDRYRCPPFAQEVLCDIICGVKIYMTHGHLHNVKLSTFRLLKDARSVDAQAVLFGHTHKAECFQEEDGLWVLNPGSCGYGGGSAGVIETKHNKIISCRILRQEDLEDLK